MDRDILDRRKFHELSAAALAGLAAGTLAGCNQNQDAPGPAAAKGELHLCRGLNDCKGQGVSGDNACRGQGECATITHACAAENACKGQGGCGESAGINACKGKGGCHVPLMDSAWETVRKRKETAWSAAMQEFGEAPAKKEES